MNFFWNALYIYYVFFVVILALQKLIIKFPSFDGEFHIKAIYSRNRGVEVMSKNGKPPATGAHDDAAVQDSAIVPIFGRTQLYLTVSDNQTCRLQSGEAKKLR